MSPTLRKFTLTAHVTSSVGWLGAVACFLVLAAVGSVFTPKARIRHRPPRSYPNGLTTNPPPPTGFPHPTASQRTRNLPT